MPGRLRRYIGFTRVNDQVLRAVRRTIDDDEEFRDRVRDAIGEAGGAEAVGDAGWLLLDRPDGWEDELDALVAAEAAQAAEAQAARTESRASRQLERVSDALATAEAERSTALADAARLRDELAAERTARAEVERRMEELAGDRADAVRKLKAVEDRLASRTNRQRELEAELADTKAQLAERSDEAEGSPPPPRGVTEVPEASAGEPDPDPVVGAVHAEHPSPQATHDVGSAWSDPAAAQARLAEAGRAAATLAAALSDLAALLGPEVDGVDGSLGGSAAPPGRRERRRRPGGRRALRVPVGLFDDSPEAAAHLLRHPGVMVLVDGWNVSMAGWPDLDKSLQRTRLLDALRSLETLTGARITVVFDSALDERSLPAASLVRSVQVRFTPVGVSADDEILAAIDTLPPEQAVVVVTADREIADGAVARGANVVPTSALLALL